MSQNLQASAPPKTHPQLIWRLQAQVNLPDTGVHESE